MSAGLNALQSAVADLQQKVADNTAASKKLIADVEKLLAGASGGPQPGQVIVNQSDIDALTASATAASATLAGETADETAEDQKVPTA